MPDKDTKDTKDPAGLGSAPGHQRRQNMVNMAASVRSRLTMRAHMEGEEPEYGLTRYALERLLYRLGRSPYADGFILKGAFLFVLWEGRPHRATRDLDLLGFGPSDVGRIEQVFRELCGAAGTRSASANGPRQASPSLNSTGGG